MRPPGLLTLESVSLPEVYRLDDRIIHCGPLCFSAVVWALESDSRALCLPKSSRFT